MGKKRRKIDGSFVKEIASMQEKIDNYERLIWGLADYAENGNKFIPKLTEDGSYTELAVKIIYDNLEKLHENKNR